MRNTQVAVRPGAPRREKRVLDVALVGCGERGLALARTVGQTGNTRLVMATDADVRAAGSLGDRFGIPWTTSLDGVLEHPEVDAVIICTPHHLHAAQAIRAAEAGKHVVVEKPLAASLEEAVTVVRAAGRAGVRLSVVLSYRFLPHVQRARALVEAGALGDLFGASLIFQRDALQSGWRARRAASGGGVLITQAIHYLDWLRYVPGREVATVSAEDTLFEGEGDVEDTAVLWLRYENGALGTVNASSSVRGTGSGGDLVEFRLWGRDGHLSLTPPYEYFSLRLVDSRRPGWWHRLAEGARAVPRDVQYLRRFAERVLRDEEPEVTGEDGLAVQAIVEAAYRSRELRHPVPVERGPWTQGES